MIVKSGTDQSVERHKSKLNLTGDVYIVDHFMENLSSHRRLFPNSTAMTIDEAEQERIAHEAEQAELARLAAETEERTEGNEQPTDGEE